MRREKHLFERVIDFGNLYRAFVGASAGPRAVRQPCVASILRRVRRRLRRVHLEHRSTRALHLHGFVARLERRNRR